MNDFNIGERVYYLSRCNSNVSYNVITGSDLIDGQTKYILHNMFGYVTNLDLFRTKEEAEKYLQYWLDGKDMVGLMRDE
jgi:hypothetical protein